MVYLDMSELGLKIFETANRFMKLIHKIYEKILVYFNLYYANEIYGIILLYKAIFIIQTYEFLLSMFSYKHINLNNL